MPTHEPRASQARDGSVRCASDAPSLVGHSWVRPVPGWPLFASVIVGLLALACGLAIGRGDDVRRSQRDEASVRPGINERFLDEELDVDEWVARFEVESREIYAERRAIAASLGLEHGMAIADIGAGTGLFLALFAEAVGPSGRVYAVEIAPRFLDHLAKRANDEGLSAVRVVEGTARSVALADASVDVAFVCDVYHHFEYPVASLASLMRAIRPGGVLVVIDFDRIPGQSRPFILEHVRAGREVFAREIEAAGFERLGEVEIAGLSENYVLRFRRPWSE